MSRENSPNQFQIVSPKNFKVIQDAVTSKSSTSDDYEPIPSDCLFNSGDHANSQKSISFSDELKEDTAIPAEKLSESTLPLDCSEKTLRKDFSEGLDSKGLAETAGTKKKFPRNKSNAIKFSDEGYIREINFKSSEKTDHEPFLKNFENWKDIEDFSVITGVNGSGKTRILKYIRDQFSNRDGNILFISAGSELDHESYGSRSYNPCYGISDEEACISAINQVVAFIENMKYQKYPCSLASPFADSIMKSIERKGILEEIKKCLDSGDKKTVVDRLRSIANSTIEYERNDLCLHDPLSFLGYVVQVYTEAEKILEMKAGDISQALTLYELYKNKKNADPQIALEEFFKQIVVDVKFKEEIIKSFARFQLGPSPIEHINKILKKYDFKYFIAFKNLAGSNRSRQLLFLKNDGSSEVESRELSSGEHLIIGLMIWQYYAQGLNSENNPKEGQLDNKIKIMLLDEPDRHIDPKFCKTFYKILYEELVIAQRIQVIMTTHRVDTISLAPDDRIYMIRDDKTNPYIEKTNKILALFRVTSNLRELVGYHHKVYAESVDDARFYEAVYSALKQLCDEIREDGVHEWCFREDNEQRILSNRYQMSFYSVSKKKISGKNKGDGGCKQVKSAIIRDITAIENLAKSRTISNHLFSSLWIKTRTIFTDPKWYKSYGILDNDYNADHYVGELAELKDQSVILERHSLENYLLDPIIFCSILRLQDIADFINGSRLVKHNKPAMLKICERIKKILEVSNLSDELKNELQRYLQYYFNLIFSIMSALYPNSQRGRENRGGMERDTYNSIQKKSQNFSTLCDKEVIFIIAKNQILNLLYPKEALNVRGHDIEEFFIGKGNANAFKERVIDGICNQGLKYFPLDLAEVFFKLNEKIRNNAHEITRTISKPWVPVVPARNKDRLSEDHQKINYYRKGALVPAIGDGNCAFNSLALGLGDLIFNDNLPQSNGLELLLIKLKGSLNLCDSSLNALKQWLQSNSNIKTWQTTFAPILRSFIVEYICNNYEEKYESIYQEFLVNAYGNLDDDTFRAHPHIQTKFEAEKDLDDKTLIEWWNKEGKKEYFKNLGQSGIGRKHWGSEVEIGILAFLLEINIVWKKYQHGSQKLGIHSGFFKKDRINAVQGRLLQDFGLVSSYLDYYLIYEEAMDNLESLRSVNDDVSKKIVKLIKNNDSRLFPEKIDGIENIEALKEQLIKLKILIPNKETQFISTDGADIDKARIIRYMKGLSNEEIDLLKKEYKKNVPCFVVSHTGMHWSYIRSFERILNDHESKQLEPIDSVSCVKSVKPIIITTNDAPLACNAEGIPFLFIEQQRKLGIDTAFNVGDDYTHEVDGEPFIPSDDSEELDKIIPKSQIVGANSVQENSTVSFWSQSERGKEGTADVVKTGSLQP